MEDVNKIRMVWMEHPEKRLEDWRNFRQDISSLPIDQICERIQIWWSLSPQSNISIDPYNLSSWPTPWEMVYAGDMCKFSTALGISYTMYCINKDVTNMIMMVNDLQNNDTYMVAIIDDIWVLNYNTCEMVLWTDVKDTLQIQDSWACKDVVERHI